MFKDLALFVGFVIGTTVALKVVSSNPVIRGGLAVAASWGLTKFGHKGLAIPVLVGGAGSVATSVLDTVGSGLTTVNGATSPVQLPNLQEGTQMGEYTLYSADTPGHRR